jgi:AmiR/NasT family two-component response regulator
MIQQLKISEDEAHQRLRSAAMEQQKSMLDVAKKIVSISAKQK